MDGLLSELDALAGDDLAPAFGPELLERLRGLLAAQNRLAAEVARTVRECEVSGAAEVDGLKTMASWLRGHGHLATTEAARVVRTGRALAHLPAEASLDVVGRGDVQHRDELQALMRMCTATGVRPVIDVELPLQQAREGFERMLEGRTAGKIVFTL